MVNIYDIKQQTIVFRVINRPSDFYSTWLGSRHFVYADIEEAGTQSILYCSDVRGRVGSYKILARLENGNGYYIRQIKGSDYHLLYCIGGNPVCGHQVACCNVTTDSIPHCSQHREFITSAHSGSCKTNGRIIGTKLSPDNQFIYVNCRPFLNSGDEMGWVGPDISQNVEIRVYRTDSLQQVQVLCGHQCYTPKNNCFMIFLDVSHNYVASGAEDRLVHIWDRHSGAKLAALPGHTSVVNAVAFNPCNEGMLVSASDDYSLRVWHSKCLLKGTRGTHTQIQVDLEK
jgi:hypothetical protein